jgi:hypothetical protein
MTGKRSKHTLPEKYQTWLLALSLVLLIAVQALSKYTEPILVALRYVLFSAMLISYGYVFFINNRERIEKKKNKESD